jgi:uracil-DNA glycosylase family 4
MTPAEERIARAQEEYRSLVVLEPLAAQSLLVPGSGPTNAPFLVVGEAPGEEEVRQGKPFVGRSGRQLFEMLAEVGVQRRMCYVTNVVLYRPPSNRTPHSFEVAASRARLAAEILAVRPGLVITCGATAKSAVSPLAGRISDIHGRIGTVAIADWPDSLQVPWLPTFHPAAALRSTDTAELMAEDLAVLRRITQGMRMVMGS